MIATGIEDGRTALGGYGSGAEIPVVCAVMREMVEIVFDHRVYNPPDEQAFADAFLGALRF